MQVFFKKKKLYSPGKKTHKTPLILSFVGVFGIIYLGVLVVGATANMNFNVFNFSSGSGVLDIIPSGSIRPGKEVEQENKENTYILLTGRGGGTHDAPNLTDTIILAGINPNEQKISLLSIPRDLWVEYPNSGRSGKINSVYENALSLGEDIAIERLQSKVTEITGKEIDYYMNVDFQGFIKLVDALGGVEVSLENNFVDYEYPDNNLGYKTFILRKGTWTLDGEVALMYARSRHSTSDFDRSARQQQILGSLKNKVSNLGYLKDAKKILQLYNIFSQYVVTDMKLRDMVSVGLEIKSWESSKVNTFNLNDSCFPGSISCSTGGFLYVPLREYFGGASVLLPNTGLAASPSSYDEISKFSSFIFDSPSMYAPEKEIIIYNASGSPRLAGKLAELLLPYGFLIDSERGTQTLREKKFEKSILYYNGIDSSDEILKNLESFIDIDIEMVTEPVYSDSNVRIEIVLADENSF